jgi:mxaA protein
VNGLTRLALAATVTLLIAGPACAASLQATVEQPRSFGHVIGDLVTQRVLLNAGGKEFVPAELPTTGRLGVWFERRAVRVDTDARGRRWLAVTYQLMNSPQALRVVTLPAWKLKSRGSGDELSVPEWPMSLGPLTPEEPFSRAGLGGLRPDRTASPIPLAPIQRGFGIGVAGFILCLGAWGAWWVWRGWRSSARQPFAVACREIEKVQGAAPEAWHALHRAFDRTAGRAVHGESIDLLFQRAPQLLPMRASIEQFYRQSGARFFGGETPESLLSVPALCRDLRRIEKRYES